MDKQNKTLGSGFVDLCNRWVPSSMVLAMLLTLVAAVLALIFTDAPIITSTETTKSILDAWTGGFWNLLTFGMQMTLVMLTGYIVASAPIVKRGLRKIAYIPNSTLSAFVLTGLVTFILFYIHWGIGMMSSIVLGQQILVASRKKGYKIHVPALVAYMYGCINCANGISQAGPLNAASNGFLQSMVASDAAKAYVPESIPLTATILNGLITFQNIILWVVITVIIYIMLPKTESEIEGIDKDFEAQLDAPIEKAVKLSDCKSPAEWLNNSPLINWVIGVFGMIYVVQLLATKGIVGLSTNNYNFIMLMVALLVCGNPETFCKCVQSAIGTTWGVIIQFPFYAGIYGIITGTSLNTVIVNAFTSIASTKSFPVIAYIYSCILNIFVPSGGSKFVIEAPYLLEVCNQLNVNVANIINAYTYGDFTTNLIQPFWALAFVAMFKIDFKKIIPYTIFMMLGMFVVNLAFIGLIY